MSPNKIKLPDHIIVKRMGNLAPTFVFIDTTRSWKDRTRFTNPNGPCMVAFDDKQTLIKISFDNDSNTKISFLSHSGSMFDESCLKFLYEGKPYSRDHVKYLSSSDYYDKTLDQYWHELKGQFPEYFDFETMQNLADSYREKTHEWKYETTPKDVTTPPYEIATYGQVTEDDDKSYETPIEWNGRPYPYTKVDCTFEYNSIFNKFLGPICVKQLKETIMEEVEDLLNDNDLFQVNLDYVWTVNIGNGQSIIFKTEEDAKKFAEWIQY